MPFLMASLTSSQTALAAILSAGNNRSAVAMPPQPSALPVDPTLAPIVPQPPPAISTSQRVSVASQADIGTPNAAAAAPPVPQLAQARTMAYSPIPEPESVIPWFVDDLVTATRTRAVFESVDADGLIEHLEKNDFTPDVIEKVPNERLESLLGMSVGQVIQLKMFAEQWAAHLNEKIAAGSPEV